MKLHFRSGVTLLPRIVTQGAGMSAEIACRRLLALVHAESESNRGRRVVRGGHRFNLKQKSVNPSYYHGLA